MSKLSTSEIEKRDLLCRLYLEKKISKSDMTLEIGLKPDSVYRYYLKWLKTEPWAQEQVRREKFKDDLKRDLLCQRYHEGDISSNEFVELMGFSRSKSFRYYQKKFKAYMPDTLKNWNARKSRILKQKWGKAVQMAQEGYSLEEIAKEAGMIKNSLCEPRKHFMGGKITLSRIRKEAINEMAKKAEKEIREAGCLTPEIKKKYHKLSYHKLYREICGRINKEKKEKQSLHEKNMESEIMRLSEVPLLYCRDIDNELNLRRGTALRVIFEKTGERRSVNYWHMRLARENIDPKKSFRENFEKLGFSWCVVERVAKEIGMPVPKKKNKIHLE